LLFFVWFFLFHSSFFIWFERPALAFILFLTPAQVKLFQPSDVAEQLIMLAKVAIPQNGLAKVVHINWTAAVGNIYCSPAF
jgi:hypothetical protein